jgi:hypothetical protein
VTATTLERIDKSRRLLVDGRLTVTRVEGNLIVATCRGDSGEVYHLGYDSTLRWHCDCPARTTCSHLKSLMLVTVRKP